MQYWLTRFQIIFFEKSRKILVSSEMGMFLAAFELSNGRKKAYSLARHGTAWHGIGLSQFSYIMEKTFMIVSSLTSTQCLPYSIQKQARNSVMHRFIWLDEDDEMPPIKIPNGTNYKKIQQSIRKKRTHTQT